MKNHQKKSFLEYCTFHQIQPKYDSSMGGDHLLVDYALLVKKSVAAADISLFNI